MLKNPDSPTSRPGGDNLERANLETIKDAQMNSPILEPNEQHIHRIAHTLRRRMKNRINRRSRAEYIVATNNRQHPRKDRRGVKATYSPPVLGKVLNLGNDPSISRRANSLGKSALSSAVALAG
jgi:hypothetical protein